MSYEIIYGKQFIKLSEDKVIPMLYCGSNNCYEPTRGGRMRMERGWHNFNSGGNINTLDGLLMRCKNILEREQARAEVSPEEVEANLGWYMSWSLDGTRGAKGSYNKLRSLFIDGYKKAMTVEELKPFGITVQVLVSHYSKEKCEDLGLEPINVCPETSEELERLINEYEPIFKAAKIDFYVTLRGSESSFKAARTSFKVNSRPQVAKTVEVTKAYVCKTDSGYLFTYARGRRVYITSIRVSAKTFYNKRQAEKYAEKFNKKYVSTARVIEFEIEKKRVKKTW